MAVGIKRVRITTRKEAPPMTKSRSPATRWTSQHGRKIQHRTPVTAWWHALRLNIKFRPRRWGVYPCQWGQWYRDGETARKHWHVGQAGKRTGIWREQRKGWQ